MSIDDKSLPDAGAFITIVIGTYNRLPSLKKCLESIARETSVPYVVEVSDAGSTDGTVDFLRQAMGPQLRVTFEGKKVGQAKALNAVFRRAATPYVCWLSDDNELVNKGVDIAVAAMEADPSLGMVGLKVKDRAGPFITAPYVGGISSTSVININQGVVRSEVMKSVGYFSESFGTYGIDPDLTAKILLAGHDVALTRQVCVMHDRDWPEERLDDPSHPFSQSRQFHALYRAKYDEWMGTSTRWFLSRLIWKGLRVLFPRSLHLDRADPVLGFLVRDWHNFFAARFVSITRELNRADKTVYLRQHPDTALVSKGVPADKPLQNDA
jgi:GT2 family glycosyltransferase